MAMVTSRSTQQLTGSPVPPDAPASALPSDAARRVVTDLFGPAAHRRFAVRYWDGSTDVPPGTPGFTLVITHPAALRRMLLPPTEMAMVRAYLHGDIDVVGDIEEAAALGDVAVRRITSPSAGARLLRDVLALSGREAARRPPAGRVASGLRSHGRAHSLRRDAHAVRFHYDVGNAFYQLWLDERMVYSCGYFANGDESLDDGQVGKLEHVCRKLRLRAGEHLLDIGCGWGALAIHAAQHHGVRATGITLSLEQAELARERVTAAGLGDRVTIELRDYRTLLERHQRGRYDKIASVGMVEHVGARRLDAYFTAASHALRPGGLFLNHGIVSIARARPQSRRARIGGRLWGRNQFIRRYVFPDGDLLPAAAVLASAERAGFELRDVESLREHYTTTLRHWVQRLEASEERARALVGDVTYRVWRLYMAASAYGFRTGRIGVIQSLLAKPHADGRAELPRTRDDLCAR